MSAAPPAARRPLNPEQQAAIDAAGLVFVSAGAGTGKTTVLVERFCNAVRGTGGAVAGAVDIGSILVITYTDRAAGELRTRIRRRLLELGEPALARELDGAWISTIHGFCARLLRSHPFAAGLDPRFRVLDGNQALVVQGEAFRSALAGFLAAGEDDGRPELLATYGAAGLRAMLTGVHERLRSAGRPLVLELGEHPGAAVAVEAWRAAAEVLAASPAAGDAARAAARAALDFLARERAPEELLDPAAYRARGPGRAHYLEYEAARKAVEQAALDALAARDRDLLQELLERFAAAYAAAKERESALDFEDLQVRARDLLRDRPDVRRREAWRFRCVLVDEFQDTNRLQCELVDLVSGDGEGALAGQGAGESAGAPGAGPSAASSAAAATTFLGAARELFLVGDEFQSIYRFRHADVQVFRERRAAAGSPLALTRNYRSRPEVLDVVNHLFAEDFGPGFLPLQAAGELEARPDGAGPAVELLVTDKASYRGSDVRWREAEARHVARRVRELVDAGEARARDVVVLFQAGTDAELYELALREQGLGTFRATGRNYYGQQQVLDLLAYLRLLRNRYDDQALVTVLASPFVGVTNDGLVALRRAAGRRPLFAGLERGAPPLAPDGDRRLLDAFRQRFDRLAARMHALSLERLCEEVVAAHDYDLAVLAQPDGRRRYANLRKLGRLARSFEELRGPDIEGFVRFVRDQDDVGARELEAVAEEEDADVVRLLTIHAAKGLEFGVVVVADTGRDTPVAASDEILVLPDGRFGFKVAHPLTGKRRAVLGYDAVRAAEQAAETAERHRLYYVAMTRAIDRLIVAGSIDPERSSDRETPIGWVLGRLGLDGLQGPEAEAAASEPVPLERAGAQLLLRVDRVGAAAAAAAAATGAAASEGAAGVGVASGDRGAAGEADAPGEPGQLALFGGAEGPVAAPDAPPWLAEPPAPADEPAPTTAAAATAAAPPALPAVLPPLAPVPAPPLHEVRRLSFSALSLYDRCSYRWYVERVVGLRERPPAPLVPGETPALAATEIGDEVHLALERVDLRDPAAPRLTDLAAAVRGRRPAASDEEVARVHRLVTAYAGSPLARRVAALPAAAPERPFAFVHDGVLLRGRLDVLSLEPGGAAVVIDYKTNVLGSTAPADAVERGYRLQRLVYALACLRSGARSAEVVYLFLERPDEPVSVVFGPDDVPALEAELSAAIARVREGALVPTPGDFTCSGCPALDLVCAGPRLPAGRGGGSVRGGASGAGGVRDDGASARSGGADAAARVSSDRDSPPAGGPVDVLDADPGREWEPDPDFDPGPDPGGLG